MTNREAIEIIKSAQAQIERDYPMDYAVAFDMAISALQAQDLQLTCNNLATDTISRKAAIDALMDEFKRVPTNAIRAKDALEKLPFVQPEDRCGECDAWYQYKNYPRQPEIIYCKDCRKHNVNFGYKKDCCALYEWRGISYGHEHDYQYCSHAERKEDE